ncbi:MAG: tRNA (5-methylaminomethyl-2-thiouridine)(34)-methyltransferase MnmD [Bacteroidota bacterium]|nr:tRNA (5-methylaminomethyl-2-thiouridine)(34)-methyltransferase MnmD [Bacteroidota bacterium]
MERQKIPTGDGSSTIFLPELNECYHSRFGAVTESMHVFIHAGFDLAITGKDKISLFEMGSGTGLNIWLTCCSAIKKGISVDYTALEPFPPDPDEILSLNYTKESEPGEKKVFEEILHAPSNIKTQICKGFTLHKISQTLEKVSLKEHYFDLVYFDAFGPEVQPELWTPELFGMIGKSMKPEGILVTYSAKGTVKQALRNSGFRIERLPGPPGKRHMVRGIKQSSD